MGRWTVISPDGIPIGHKDYNKKIKAEQALKQWVKTYEFQGYYSTVIGPSTRVRLSLEDLPKHCKIIQL